MNPPRAGAEDYIQFLLATPKVCSAAEAGRVQPERPRAPGHDAFTRLLTRLEPDAGALWAEVAPHVRRSGGALVLDDSTLDKPHAKAVGLVGRHWSGKHKSVVRGINLLTALWTDGDALWPCDYRLAGPGSGATKNDHFRAMIAAARDRGLAPSVVLFDSWYSGLENLKAVRDCGWVFLTQVRCNRRVSIDFAGKRPISGLPVAASGTVVHLEGFGPVRAFRVALTNGGAEHWVTNDLGMDESGRLAGAERAWGVEEYHRGLKQFTGVERCQARLARSQRNHIGLAIRAFVRLEWQRYRHGTSWFEAKWQVVRRAVRAYLADPLYRMPDRATA